MCEDKIKLSPTFRPCCGTMWENDCICPPELEDVLEERGRCYGDYALMSSYSRSMKRMFQNSPSWVDMTDEQQESMDLIATKIARLLVGNPEIKDTWLDIAGYATLVADQLEE